jgi:hypothetical protein
VMATQPFIEINEFVDVPGELHREFRPTGKTLRMRTEAGRQVSCEFVRQGKVTGAIELVGDQARELRDWLQTLPL